MKKYILTLLGIAIVAAIAVFAAKGLEKSSDKITLNAGGIKQIVSYKDLGVSVPGSAGLASLFSPPQGKISVDSETLARTVLRLFPFLSSQEEAHRSFFITSENQKIKTTFNLRALVAQLSDENPSGEPKEADVQIIPEVPAIALPDDAHKKNLVLRIAADDIAELKWEMPLHEISAEKIEDFLASQVAPRVERAVQNATIEQFYDEGKAARAEVSGIARNGFSLQIDDNVQIIQNSISNGTFDIQLKLKITPAKIYNDAEIDVGEMQLLGLGRSNFAGSPQGRMLNIQKGLRERMNNIIVPPGATFSFNSFLGPVTAAAGWKTALGIFGGKNLQQTLGGGLCQVSTTVYRAVLFAGLPIIKRTPHSLYVNYYKKYGEGLDATIFVGGPDLVFLNDTSSYILIQSYDDGDDGYVKIFGISDGRKTTLSGPYHFNNIPAEKGIQPRKNEIIWFRAIERNDGSKNEETITSRYRAVPHK